METLQPCDKALKHGCFVTIKKLLDSLGKKWGHPKKVQKSDVLTTRGFNPFGIGLKHPLIESILVCAVRGHP